MDVLVNELSVNQMHVAFMVACTLLVMLVYFLTRSGDGDITREAARNAKAARERGPAQRLRIDSTFGSPADRTPWFFLSADLSSLAHIVALVSMALLVVTGWRIPMEVMRMMGGEAEFGLLAPQVDLGPIGRAAQVVGAISFALCAMRLIRMLVPIVGILVMLGLCVAAFDYVLDAGLIFSRLAT